MPKRMKYVALLLKEYINPINPYWWQCGGLKTGAKLSSLLPEKNKSGFRFKGLNVEKKEAGRKGT